MKSFQIPILSIHGAATRGLAMSLLGLCLLSGLDTPAAHADFVFGEPMNLTPLVNTSDHEGAPCLSPNGRELYFTRGDPGEIWVARRATPDSEWGPPTNLGPIVNIPGIDDGRPSLSADGLSLYFDSARPAGYAGYVPWDLWMTTRATVNDDWGPPVNLGPTVNTGDDWAPSISADGLELYFTSDRPGGYGGYDLWVTRRATVNDNWAPPINLGATINTSVFDFRPSISADGLLLFLASDRPGGYGGRYDLWVSRRRTTTDPWGPPENLGPTVNTSKSEQAASISADGLTLYFDSMRPGGAGGVDIWQAPVLPIVDFNGDGIVDAADVVIMIEHWLTDYSLCDIGPMPWGDGIVDVKDLIVLSEYLFTDLRIFVDDDAPADPVPSDPLTSDPLENGSTEHPFDSIQEAIDAARETGCVVVLPGTYTGQGNCDITFRGKTITVRSLDPSDSAIVATTMIDCQGTQAAQHQGFLFNTGESAQSVLAGLTITNAFGYYGGGINCTANSSPTISKCVLRGNKAVKGGGGLCNQGGSPKVSNCLFSGNSAESGGGLYNSSNALVVNCTFINNLATSGSKIHNQGGALTLTNCILWNNSPPEIRVAAGTVSVTYSDIRGGFTGEGNIAADPLFADAANGDYHLKSHWGRWDPVNESWVIDGITSPCIDTGDPSSPVGDEPEPNGGRINMGAHGGTPEASKSP